ncbi:DUF1609 domain-containing protein [Encephalitozoon cuniculi]|nr:DUF1609 domain-containing protein [Encephalitozoon cuniculi]
MGIYHLMFRPSNTKRAGEVMGSAFRKVDGADVEDSTNDSLHMPGLSCPRNIKFEVGTRTC